MFWSIIVAIFTFGWMFLAILRYRDGVEADTTHMDHIEVGSFPVDRHHTTTEVFFYVIPTVIVAWLVVLALSSNTAVWTIPAKDDAHDMVIIGKQWFWEYEYVDALTWEDNPAVTYVDVTWSGTTLSVASTNSAATKVSVVKGTDTYEGELDQLDGTYVREDLAFNPLAFLALTALTRRWIGQRQLLFISQRLDEIGRMVGGWLRQIESNRPPRRKSGP